MLPWQLAKKWHDKMCKGVTFEEVLGSFLHDGYVWSGRTEFVLARETKWEGGSMYAVAVQPNCWLVHLAAAAGGGNPFKRFLQLAPHPLEYVAWQRRGGKRFHVYRWEKFKRKLGGEE